jgi:hypothetical protein
MKPAAIIRRSFRLSISRFRFADNQGLIPTMPEITARKLNEKWGIGARHALYRKNGTWYHILIEFPGALFDENGFILFSIREYYEGCYDLLRTKQKEKNWINARKGIASIAGYTPFSTLTFAAHSELPLDHPGGSAAWEGAMTSVLVNRFERDPGARQQCIQIYGAVCSVCRFDFADSSGEIGRGYIHVHHLIPLSNIGKKYIVNPKDGLRPVCPNCHEMLHTRKPNPLTIEELREASTLERQQFPHRPKRL